MTKFCQTEVEVLPGFSFILDGNSKITAGNGTYEDPKPNALSLPPISTCPGSTPTCRAACYVQGLAKNAPEVYAVYQQNERVLHRCLLTEAAFLESADALADHIERECKGGFRWHVSGDIISNRHAAWISLVCQSAKDVPSWIYTRTFSAIPFLQAPNLTVNLSADRDNLQEALATQRGVVEWTTVRICYLASPGEPIPELPDGSVIFPDYPCRGRDLFDPRDHSWWQGLSHRNRSMVCPPDFFGQSAHMRCGPCKKCLINPAPPAVP